MPRKDDWDEDWDDGRTIAEMDVDGMPWSLPKTQDVPGNPQLDKEERRLYIFAAVRSALLIGLAYAAVFGLFILLLTRVWAH